MLRFPGPGFKPWYVHFIRRVHSQLLLVHRAYRDLEESLGVCQKNAFSGPRGKLGTRAWETLGVKDVSPSTSWAQYLKGGYCHVPFHGMASVTVELHIYGSDAYADNLSIVAFWPSGSIM